MSKKWILVCSVFVGFPDILAPAVVKAFHVRVVHGSVLFHLLATIDGEFVMGDLDGFNGV